MTLFNRRLRAERQRLGRTLEEMAGARLVVSGGFGGNGFMSTCCHTSIFLCGLLRVHGCGLLPAFRPGSPNTPRRRMHLLAASREINVVAFEHLC
jgi:hypothetical protein